MKNIYKAKPGSRINDNDANIIGEFCDKLYRKFGTITAEMFVTAAKKDKTIRPYLEWDNTLAAEQYRLHQARILIGSFTVTIERHDKEVTVRGLQYVDSENGYVPSSKIFSNTEMTKEVVAKAKKEAISWFHRYQNIRGFDNMNPIFDAIEKAMIENVAESMTQIAINHAAEE
jgi:hypothetical protein